MNVLDTAKTIVYGDREKTYGTPDINLQRIADQWETYIIQKYNVEVNLSAEDVCWMMADLKKVRQMNQHKRDNLVDAIGYIALIERLP